VGEAREKERLCFWGGGDGCGIGFRAWLGGWEGSVAGGGVVLVGVCEG